MLVVIKQSYFVGGMLQSVFFEERLRRSVLNSLLTFGGRFLIYAREYKIPYNHTYAIRA